MKKASVSELRYDFKKIERLLRQGEEIEITKRKQVIARLVPERNAKARQMPDIPRALADHLWRQGARYYRRRADRARPGSLLTS